MLRLLKYELRKTLASKLILLAITVIAEAIFLFGFWTRRDNTTAIGAALLFFIAIIGIGLMGILSLATLHKDMNTKQGYMLFMTPNSCYRILGAKVLECGISLLIAGVFFFALGVLDFSILLGRDNNQQVWDLFTELMQSVNKEIVIDVPHVSALFFSMLCAWLCTVTTAYFSDVVSSSLLNGQKWNWLITFAIFLVLNYAISKLLTLVPASLGVITVLVLQGVIALVLAAVMYVITARLMEKYLSV